jgi:hypothetical protein
MKDIAIKEDKILLPNESVDMSKWACIACDQFTSENEYWESLESFVKGSKTTLDLTLPEIYLEDNAEKRIEKINKNIKEYLESGVFTTYGNGFILTVRKTPFVERRIGLVASLDLEKYEYSQKSSSLVRATEGTIEERIPPRLKIRKNADIEFPHVMVLFDDEKREITEELYKNRQNYKKVYDFIKTISFLSFKTIYFQDMYFDSNAGHEYFYVLEYNGSITTLDDWELSYTTDTVTEL